MNVRMPSSMRMDTMIPAVTIPRLMPISACLNGTLSVHEARHAVHIPVKGKGIATSRKIIPIAYLPIAEGYFVRILFVRHLRT